MFTARIKVEDETDKVTDAVDDAQFRNFGHAAASIRKKAMASITKSPEPSLAGQPPHTRGRRGKNIRTAIQYDATKEDAIVGPRFSYVGPVGEAHEFGGLFRGEYFDERAFMGPALESSLDRFADDWEASL